MKILAKQKFLEAAGIPVSNNRDFSLYDGAPYECVCGGIHTFSQYSGQNYGSTGASAKFMVQCPDNPNAATIIKTTNKYLMFFDRFISLAGYIEN